MVKYRVIFKSELNELCVVDISNEAYEGQPIVLRGVGSKGCIISRDCGDEPYTAIIPTKASITLYQGEHQPPVDLDELEAAQDFDFRVTVTLDGKVKFQGYLIVDGIQRPFQSTAYELNLTATDGLKLLGGMFYYHNNLPGGRNTINYFRQILGGSSNLNLPLPIMWVNDLRNTYYPTEDVFSGSLSWSARGEGYTDYNGNYKDCLYILENLLLSMQCRMVQDEGKWVVWRINDVVSGMVSYKEISADLTTFDITTYEPTSILKKIGGKGDGWDYCFIGEDAILTNNPALKSVSTTYEQDQRDNILPNGNMDIVSFALPIYWKLLNPTNGFMSQEDSLSSTRGTSVKIINQPGASNIFMPVGSLPIDTDVLYTFLNFGFKFSIEAGAVVDADGYIQWAETQAKFNVQVNYYANGKNYYLNEFGFWSEQFTLIYPMIANLKQGDVAQLDFNAKQDIILPLPEQTPLGQTPEPSIFVAFNLQPGVIIYLDDIYLNTDNNSDVYVATNNSTKNTDSEQYTLKISSSHNGFYVSNFMTHFAMSGVEKFFKDGEYVNTLTAINSHAILRNRYKPSQVFDGSIYGPNYSYAQMYNIKTLDGKNFIPLKSDWNIETNTANLTLMEVRNDGNAISVAHYGSNDKTKLSN